MTTLTPLQVNDVKRLELAAYERDIKYMLMYYDSIAFSVERQQARLRRKIQLLRVYGE